MTYVYRYLSSRELFTLETITSLSDVDYNWTEIVLHLSFNCQNLGKSTFYIRAGVNTFIVLGKGIH